MKGKRWTEEEDTYLRDQVICSISEGGSQLDAFDRVSKELGRTSGACGFRWNAVLRQQYPVAYMEAKKKRVYRHLQKKRTTQVQTFQDLFSSLEQAEKDWDEMRGRVESLQQRVEGSKGYLQQLRQENRQLRQSQKEPDVFKQKMLDHYQELLKLVQKLQKKEKSSLTDVSFPSNIDPIKADNDTFRKPNT